MRLIDANWILGEIKHDLGCYEIGKLTEDEGLYVELRDVVKMVCAAPTIDPASLRPKGEWISVEDRLPDRKQGTVLMVKSYRGKAYVDIGEIFCDRTYSCCSDAYAMNRKEHILTHWMPLPEPPNCGADMRGEENEREQRT